ncbi:MAG: PAS domain S-box protein [Balneolaceae bacterium]|nr:PAS domain S-box protein [Balneolaceae bacterium]
MDIKKSPPGWRMAVIFALVVLPGIIIGGYSYYKLYHNLTDQAFNRRNSTVQLASVLIKERFDRVYDVGISLATRVKFRNLIIENDWEGARSIVRDIPTNFPFINHLILMDTLGKAMQNAPSIDHIIGQDFSNTQWFRNVKQAKKPLLSNIHHRTSTHEPIIAYVFPVWHRKIPDQLLGYLVLEMKIETISEWGMEMVSPEEGGLYLVDGKGLKIPEYTTTQTVLKNYQEVPPVQRVLKGEKGTGIYFNPLEQEKRLVSYEAVPEYPWGVVSYQPLDIAFAERNNGMYILSIFLGIIILLNILFAVIILRIIKKHNEAKERFRSLISSSQDAIITANQKGNILSWNKGAETTFGYTANEIIGKPLTTIMPEKFRKLHTKGMQRHLKEGSSNVIGKTVELTGLHKNSTEFPLELSLNTWQSGQEHFFIGIIRDVSERKKAEGRFRDLMESAPDAMIIINESDTIELVNKQTEVLFGYRREELIGTRVEKLIPDPFMHSYQEHPTHNTKNSNARGMGIGMELNGKKKNGKEFPVEISLSPLETDKGVLISAAIRDVTERKKAEERFRNLMESAPDAMVIINESGTIELVNKQTEALFEYQREELIGTQVEELIPDSFMHSYQEHRTHYTKNPNVRGMGIGMELNGKKKNGKEFPVEISLSPLETDKGVLVSVAIRDVTKRKEDENLIKEYNQKLKSKNETLKDQKVKLEKANEDLEAFSYSVAHDLRAPLRAISGYCNLLGEEYSETLDKEGKKMFDRVIKNTTKMGTLIDDILIYSRIKRQSFTLTTLNMKKIFSDVFDELLHSEHPDEDRKITFKVDKTLEMVRGDRTLIVQAVTNILGNALKYTSNEEHAIIGVSGILTEHGYTYRIKDNGVGFDARFKDKVFEVFQRLHKESEFEGTGIGLAIVKDIINRHNGKIWVESELGEGSTVYFTIGT